MMGPEGKGLVDSRYDQGIPNIGCWPGSLLRACLGVAPWLMSGQIDAVRVLMDTMSQKPANRPVLSTKRSDPNAEERYLIREAL